MLKLQIYLKPFSWFWAVAGWHGGVDSVENKDYWVSIQNGILLTRALSVLFKSSVLHREQEYHLGHSLGVIELNEPPAPHTLILMSWENGERRGSHQVFLWRLRVLGSNPMTWTDLHD